jgi:WD40 repeat protein
MRWSARAVCVLLLTFAAVRPLTATPGRPPTISCVAFSPDGRFAAAGWTDDRLDLWELRTGRRTRIGRLPSPPSRPGVAAVALSPDNKFLLAVGQSCHVFLWDVASRKRAHSFSLATGLIHSAAFAPDGRLALFSGDGSPGCLCDVTAEQPIRQFEAPEGRLHAAAFVPANTRLGDGLHLALAGRDVRIVTTDDEETAILRGPARGVRAIAFSPDGRYAAGGGLDGTITLWELASRQPVLTVRDPLAEGEPFVSLVRFTPDGRRLFAQHQNGAARLWDLGTSKLIQTIRWKWSSAGVAASPDGRHLLFPRSTDLLLCDLETGRPLRTCSDTPPASPTVRAVAFTPDGRRVLSAVPAGELAVWDVATGQALRQTADREAPIGRAAFSPDGRFALTALPDGSPDAERLRLWDVETGRVVRVFEPQKGRPLAVVFSPDRRFALADHSSSEGSILRLWDVATGKPVRSFEPQKDPVLRMVFTPDGRRVLTEGKKVKLWDATAGRVLRVLSETDRGAAVACSPDGRLAISGGKSLKLWDLSTGRLLHTLAQLPEGPDEYEAVAFSPDGKSLAAGGDSIADVQVWDVPAGRLARTFTDRWVVEKTHALAFSPDGKLLVTGGDARLLRVWDFAAGKVVRTLGAEAERPALIRRPGPAEPNAEELDALWADLAAADAARAHRAVERLIAAGEPAVVLLRERLGRRAVSDQQRLSRLLAGLDADTFAEREKASAELEKMGDLVAPALRQALAGTPSAEVRRRLERLLAALDGPANLDRLRLLRAVEVLEKADAPHRRDALEALARGEERILAHEARAALGRLPPPPPKPGNGIAPQKPPAGLKGQGPSGR